VFEVREKTIAALFYLCDSYMWELAKTTNCQLCNGSLCNALNLGSLLQGLSNMGIWPEKPLEQYQKSRSLQSLQDSLLAIDFPAVPSVPPVSTLRFHQKGCIGILKRDFAKRVNDICQSASPVLPYHQKKLRERNRTLRLFPEKSASPPASTGK
jgi:hypothetical protein